MAAAAATGQVDSLVGEISYYSTMLATNADVVVWAGSNVTFSSDTTGPDPDPMSFAVVPVAVDSTTIAMTAMQKVLKPGLWYGRRNPCFPRRKSAALAFRSRKRQSSSALAGRPVA